MELLFSIAMLELFVGGGGRLVDIGPVTLRMLLFVVCLLAAIFHAWRRPPRDDGAGLALLLVSVYLVVHVAQLAQGSIVGAPASDMFTELQQSLYWLAAPFVAMVVGSTRMVLRAAVLVKISGAMLAMVYLGVVSALALGWLDYAALYAMLGDSPEFAFRTESFFVYKGFIYLGVAALFFVSSDGRHDRLLALLVLTAMALTLTRGFVLSTGVALAAMLFAQRRWRALSSTAVVLAAAAAVVWVVLPSVEEGLSGQRELSNLQRIEDFAFILDHIDARTLLLGHGLGVPINDRVNIENTALWALWRLGVVGLTFWLVPLLLCIAYYVRIPRGGARHRLASAFAFGTLLVYFQTLSNPYLNNPIGLSFVLVSVFALRTLARHRTGWTPAAPRPEARPMWIRPRQRAIATAA